jgi:hypothetical protein
VSQKTAKLIRKFSRATGRNSDQVQKWFEGLTTPQRQEATDMMRKTVEPPEKK